MRFKFVRLDEADDVEPRWQVFLRLLPGNWMTRQSPLNLSDAETIAFAANVARKNKQIIALALVDRWTLWINETRAIYSITNRTPGSPYNEPYMTRDDSKEPFVWVSDLEPDEEW